MPAATKTGLDFCKCNFSSKMTKVYAIKISAEPDILKNAWLDSDVHYCFRHSIPIWEIIAINSVILC